MITVSRRELLRRLGVGSAVLPFLGNLPSLAAAGTTAPKKRLVIVFSPDGVVKKNFWPTEPGPFTTLPPVVQPIELPPILRPLEPFRDQLLMLKGVHDKVQGDGDRHMRGMGCLLTGIELFPGNIQGGGETPAGWSSGLSIDQEIKNFLQSQPETATRMGSLEFGVLVPNRADTWTRMIYTGPNKPVAPIDDPYQMFHRLYGQMKDRESMQSVLDELREDLATVSSDPGGTRRARPRVRKGDGESPCGGGARRAGARARHRRAERPDAEDQPDADRTGGGVAGCRLHSRGQPAIHQLSRPAAYEVARHRGGAARPVA